MIFAVAVTLHLQVCLKIFNSPQFLDHTGVQIAKVHSFNESAELHFRQLKNYACSYKNKKKQKNMIIEKLVKRWIYFLFTKKALAFHFFIQRANRSSMAYKLL